MWGRAEDYMWHEAKADYLEDKARHEVMKGHFGHAAVDEIRSKINRVEAATDLVNPFHHPHHHRHYNPMEAGIVAAELQAERYREMTEFERLRQMELAASMGRGIPPAGGAYPYCPPAPGYMIPPAVGAPAFYPGVPPQPYLPSGYPGYPGYRPY